MRASQRRQRRGGRRGHEHERRQREVQEQPRERALDVQRHRAPTAEEVKRAVERQGQEDGGGEEEAPIRRGSESRPPRPQQRGHEEEDPEEAPRLPGEHDLRHRPTDLRGERQPVAEQGEAWRLEGSGRLDVRGSREDRPGQRGRRSGQQRQPCLPPAAPSERHHGEDPPARPEDLALRLGPRQSGGKPGSRGPIVGYAVGGCRQKVQHRSQVVGGEREVGIARGRAAIPRSASGVQARNATASQLAARLVAAQGRSAAPRRR